MTAFGRLFRTAAFQVSIAALVVFAAFAAGVILFLGDRADELLVEQAETANADEIAALRAAYDAGNINGIMNAIGSRTANPSAGLYLLITMGGEPVGGNVGMLPLWILQEAGGPFLVPYYGMGDEAEIRQAVVEVSVLPNGMRLVVGRDVSEREGIWALVREALTLTGLAVIGLALAAWWFVGRRVLKRIDAVAATTRQIVSGDLSRRLEVHGRGDEFDRLAGGLNAMLDRIEQLLAGLKEVSDNIAHDLKTPLTRLRARAEAALGGPRSADAFGEALEATIEECEQLIRTFDALLRIAQVEAGSSGGAVQRFDAAEVVRDVGELYEPVVDAADMRLDVDAGEPLPLDGHRELIAHALANLIDNAVKYGRPASAVVEAVVAAAGTGAGEAAAEADLRPGLRLTGRRSGGRVLLAVTDSGRGIAAADRDRAVQRFVRLDASRANPGSGLGLSLVAAVARLHSGTLQLGDGGPGLTAVLDLPAAGGEAGDGGGRGGRPGG